MKTECASAALLFLCGHHHIIIAARALEETSLLWRAWFASREWRFRLRQWRRTKT